MVEDDNIWKIEDIQFKCPNCFYALTLREYSQKYKCSCCKKLFPQKEIEKNEFLKFNKKEKERILVEMFGKEILTAEGRKKYYMMHKDEINAMNIKNYMKNKEIQNNNYKERYKKNPEKYKTMSKEYYEKNKKKVLEKQKERSREYYQSNKQKILSKERERYWLKKNQQNSETSTEQ